MPRAENQGEVSRVVKRARDKNKLTSGARSSNGGDALGPEASIRTIAECKFSERVVGR